METDPNELSRVITVLAHELEKAKARQDALEAVAEAVEWILEVGEVEFDETFWPPKSPGEGEDAEENRLICAMIDVEAIHDRAWADLRSGLRACGYLRDVEPSEAEEDHA